MGGGIQGHEHHGSRIEYNSTTNAEGEHDIRAGTPSMLSNMNPKPGIQCPINSGQFEFYLRLLQCEQDCETCQKYIKKLSEHIRTTHAGRQPPLDPQISDPDQSSAIEIKCDVGEDMERMECSEESDSDPDYNIESGGDCDPDYAPSPVLAGKACVPSTNFSRQISTDRTGDKRYGREDNGKGSDTEKKQSEMPFKCTDCGIGYTTKSLLAMHMRTHTGERPFKCGECEKSYSRKTHLDDHVRSHTGEKPFKCNLCFKGFSTNSGLTIHMRRHTGDKPFKCDECNKSFSLKYNLERHMKCHAGEKSFKCEECGKNFGRNDDLNRHIRLHTGEKPFKCTSATRVTHGRMV